MLYNGCKWLEWLKIADNYRKLLKMACKLMELFENSLTWMKMDGNFENQSHVQGPEATALA